MRITHTMISGLVALALLAGSCNDDSEVSTGDGGGATDVAPDGTDVTLPDREPDLAGTITKITPFVPITDDCIPADDVDPDATVSSEDPPVCTPADNNVIATILVEGDVRPAMGRKISYTITTDTMITGETANGTKVGVVASLAEGQTVDTWATGPCAESYPEQCGAEAIRVTG